MATGKDLEIRLRSVKLSIRDTIPKMVAQSMLGETHDNFAKEQYGNDGSARKWRDRWGIAYLKSGTKVFGSMEPWLRYKKLQYTGKLLNSARATSGKGWAGVSFGVPYAKGHNEGNGGAVGGDSGRRGSYISGSAYKVKLGTSPKQRKFAGVGNRTIKNVIKMHEKAIRRLI